MATSQSFVITFKQQLLLLDSVIIKNSILLGIYLYYFGWNIPTPFLYYVIAFLFLIDVFPVIILHTQYLIKNWKCVLLIDSEKRILKYTSSGKLEHHTFDDITILHYYVSYGRGTGWYSFESYRYFRIVFNDKSEVIITCLMINRIEKKLEQLFGVKAEKHLRVLAII